MRSSIFWATILILAGVLLLLGNLGVFDSLNINVWTLLWPLFLVALGIWFIVTTILGPRKAEVKEAAIPLEGATRARIKIKHGAGTMTLGSGAAPGELVSGSFGGGLDHQASRKGELLDVKMRVPDAGVFIFPWNWAPGSLDWNVRLNADIPLALECETGASRSELNLADLKVNELKLETGASATSVTLPANAGTTRVDIEAGAASVSISVPGGVAARIRAKGGLSNIHVDQTRFPASGGIYESPDFATAVNKADIDIETGVGSINVM